MHVTCRSYEDLEEAVEAGDVRSEGGRLPISYEQAFSMQHRCWKAISCSAQLLAIDACAGLCMCASY